MPTGSIPLVGFGTYLLTNEQCETAVLKALQVGYRHIDTAEFYNNHEGIAKAIAASGMKREDIFITDKVSPDGAFGAPCKTYDGVMQSLKTRLAMLNIEYVDLYLLHHPFAKEERINQWRALVDAQKQGLIKHIGVSNWSERHIEEIKAADPNLPYPAVNQIEVHPLCTQSSLIPYLKSKDIIPVAYSSLAPASSWRVDPGQASSKNKDDMSHSPIFQRILAKYEKDAVIVTESQLLLKWAIQHGYPILPKSSKPERIEDNAKLFHFTISDQDMIELDAMDRNTPMAWPIGNPLDAP